MDALVPRFSLPTTGLNESLLRSTDSERRRRDRGGSPWALCPVESVTVWLLRAIAKNGDFISKGLFQEPCHPDTVFSDCACFLKMHHKCNAVAVSALPHGFE